METTQAHLQNQLRQKESENSQITIQLKKLEQEIHRQSYEVEHYQGILAATRDKSVKDKDALKNATRIQRERAQKQEEINEEMQKQVSNLMSELQLSKQGMFELSEKQGQLNEANRCLESEVNTLRKSVLELGNIIELPQKAIRAGPIQVSEKLKSKVEELKTVKEENQALKVGTNLLKLFMFNLKSLFMHTQYRSVSMNDFLP